MTLKRTQTKEIVLFVSGQMLKPLASMVDGRRECHICRSEDGGLMAVGHSGGAPLVEDHTWTMYEWPDEVVVEAAKMLRGDK